MMDSSSQANEASTSKTWSADPASPAAKRKRMAASSCSDDEDDDRLVICGEEREILQLSKQINENLEKKATAHNLTALNVKSILHHLIKNPTVISMLMGLQQTDDNELDFHPKLTRLKAKQLVEKAGSTWSASPLKEPVVKSRSFLDVDYHNEDEDDDYDPATEVTMESDFDEDADTSLDGLGLSSSESTPYHTTKNSPMGPPRTPVVLKKARQLWPQKELLAREMEPDLPAYHTRSKQSMPDFAMDDFDEALMHNDPDVSFSTPMPDAALDRDYLEFICSVKDSCADSNRGVFDEDDTNDPEYNFLADPETIASARDGDETRMDRATEIPRKEVRGLLEDLFVLLRDDDNSVDDVASPVCSVQSEHDEEQQMDVGSPLHKHMLLLANTIPSSRRACQRFVERVIEFPRRLQSASLLGDPQQPTVPVFSDCELDQLECQMQKHVQLLLQNALLTKFEDGFAYQANQHIKMLYEIKAQADAKPPNSYFNACNLASAIELINQPTFDTSTMKPRVANCSSGVVRCNRKLKAVQPPVMVALAHSPAILYPELLPLVRPSISGKGRPLFMDSEDNLLALGIGQFHHVPFASSLNLIGRWDYIQSNMLPVKTKKTILDRVKHVRRTMSELKHVVVFTERNKIAPDMALHKDVNAKERFGLTPADWNDEEKTPWLRSYCSWLRGEVKTRAKSASSNKPARRNAPTPPKEEVTVEVGRQIDDTIAAVVSSAQMNPAHANIIDLSMPVDFPPSVAVDDQDKVIAHLLAEMSQSGLITESTVPVSDIGGECVQFDQKTPPSSSAPVPSTSTSRILSAPVSSDLDSNLTVVHIDQRTPPPSSPIALSMVFADQQPKTVTPTHFRPILPKKLQSPIRLSTIQKMNSCNRRVYRIAPQRMPFVPVPVVFGVASSSEEFVLQQQPVDAASTSTISNDSDVRTAVADANGAEVRAAPDRKSRKRSRKERERDGLEALLLNGDGEKTTLALGEAFVDDIFRRFFMHEDKLREFCQAVMSAGDASPEQAFPKIAATLGDSSLLGRLLSAFVSPEDALKLGLFDVRQPYFEALERVVMIERYFSRARSKGGAKAFFRSIKELGPLCTEQELYNKLKSLLSGDEPLWRILKPMFPNEPFDEKIRDEDFETIEHLPVNGDLFETIDSLPTAFRPTIPSSSATGSKSTCQCQCHSSASDASSHCTHCRIKVTNGHLYLHNGTKYCPAVAEHGPVARSVVDRVNWKSLNEGGQCALAEDAAVHLEQNMQETMDETTTNDSQDESDSDAVVVDHLVTVNDLCENSQLRGFLSLVDQLEPPPEPLAEAQREQPEQPDHLRSAMLDAFGSSRLSFTSNSPTRSEPDQGVMEEDIEADGAWTADEDRLILHAYKLLEYDLALTLEHVGGQIPNRSSSEVETRLRFLLTLFEE